MLFLGKLNIYIDEVVDRNISELWFGKVRSR